MKFVSKYSNYRITLKPGIPGNPVIGTQTEPGIHVKFEDGVVNIEDPDLIEKMKKHSAYDRDFIAVSEGESDPYSARRKNMEPEHNVQEIKHGVAVNKNPKPTVKFSKEQKEYIEKMLAVGIKMALEKQEQEKNTESEKKQESDKSSSTTKKTSSKKKNTSKK